MNKFKEYILLNTARNCLRYIIQSFCIKEIYVPFYTCPVVWQSIKKENCKIKFYHIDKNFMPKENLPEEDYILYTNYFGICSKNVKEITKKYKNAIIDNAQAFYMPPKGIASFNSARKFLNTSDGAFLFTKKTLNKEFKTDFSHKIDKNDKFLFTQNELRLNKKDIMYMSKETLEIISDTDMDKERQIRLKKFDILHKALCTTNLLELSIEKDDVPMYYPYLNYNGEIEKQLLNNNIYVERLWNKMPKNTTEGIFQRHLMLLPVNDGYSKEDMQRIINIINCIK